MGRRTNSLLFSLPLLLTVIGVGFFFALSDLPKIPIPRSLTGYRINSQVSPTVRMEINTKISLSNNILLRSGAMINLKINAPLAQDVKLSPTLNFANVPWRSIENKQPWILQVPDNQSLATVYAVFRYRTPDNGFMISPIIHDSIDVKMPHHKIIRTASGYFDWFDLRLTAEIMETNADLSDQEIDFLVLQKAAEAAARKTIYQTLLSVPVLTGYSLEEFLLLNRAILPLLGEAVNQLRLDKVYYPNYRSVFLVQSFSLIDQITPKNRKPLQIYPLIIKRLYKKKPKILEEPYTDRDISALIIDTRGSKWTPVLLADIIDQTGKIILSPTDRTVNNFPFIRYLRDIEADGVWKIPENAMVIKSLDVDTKNNQLIILEEYGKIIRNNKKQIERLANGNLYIVTD